MSRTFLERLRMPHREFQGQSRARGSHRHGWVRKVKAPRNRKAFSLVELLVVIAIISILAGMLLPALTGARDLARRISCSGNMKQISLATTMYTSAYKNTLPIAIISSDVYWYNVIAPFSGQDEINTGIWHDPIHEEHLTTDYGWNFGGWDNVDSEWGLGFSHAQLRGGYVRGNSISAPSRMLVIGPNRRSSITFDHAGLFGTPYYSGSYNFDFFAWHGDEGCNVGYMDGHVGFEFAGRLIDISMKPSWTKAND